MSFLIFDIETILNDEVKVEDPKPDSVPGPVYQKIVTIGALQIDSSYVKFKLGSIAETGNEREKVERFADLCLKYKPTLVTFNGRGFDLPVIAARCMAYGIPFSHYYGQKDMRYRFNADGHFDVMDYLSDYGATKPAKLDAYAKLIGFPGKVGIKGSDVAQYVADGKLQEVSDYCLCDVVQTGGVFLRLQYVRGEIDKSRYIASMTGLIALIDYDKKLKPIADGLNRPKLLLES